MIDPNVFRTGQPVYSDFPFEDVMFRYENGKAYRKFYGETEETEVPQSNDLFRQAVLGGDQISEMTYNRKQE